MANSKYSNIIADDDLMVADVPDVPMWNETMAGMFTDAKTSVSALLYLGRWWGEPTTLRQMVAFMLPGDRALYAKNYGRQPEARLPSAANLTMKPLGDGRIHYTFDGPMDLRKQSDVAANGLGTGPTVRVKADIIFASDKPIWDLHATDPHDTENDLMFPGGHMEQMGKFTGYMEFEGERFEFNEAYGVRDHSRGVRNWSTHHSHVWINGQFPSGLAFNCFRASIVGQPGYALNSAVIIRDGKMTGATIETEGLTKPGSDIWAPFEIVLKPDDGSTPVTIKVTKLWNCYQLGMYEPADLHFGAPTTVADPKSAWSLEQGGELSCDGEVGYGHVERCNREIVVDDHWRAMCTPEKIAR